jgi:hypothetical protein
MQKRVQFNGFVKAINRFDSVQSISLGGRYNRSREYMAGILGGAWTRRRRAAALKKHRACRRGEGGQISKQLDQPS